MTWLCHCLFDLKCYPFGLTPVIWLECLWVRDVILLDSSFPSMIMKTLSRRCGTVLCHLWTLACHWCISVLASSLVRLGHMTLCHLLDLERYPFGLTPVAWLDCFGFETLSFWTHPSRPWSWKCYPGGLDSLYVICGLICLVLFLLVTDLECYPFGLTLVFVICFVGFGIFVLFLFLFLFLFWLRFILISCL